MHLNGTGDKESYIQSKVLKDYGNKESNNEGDKQENPK